VDSFITVKDDGTFETKTIDFSSVF